MNILLVSDTHFSGGTFAFAENWRAVRAHMNGSPPDLIVHLGDISVDGAGREADLEEAAAHFRGLGTEIRFLPGNHDIGDNPIAPGAAVHAAVTSARLDAYRRIYGADYWSFTAGSWQVIGLNAQLLGTGGEEEERQFAWLEGALGEASGPPGLLIHKPLFRNGREDREAHVRYVPCAPRERLLDLLAPRDLRFVASGHAHQARRIAVCGVEHVWVPSASFCIPDAMQERIGEKEVGIVRLELNEDGHRFETMRPQGLIRHNLLDHAGLYPGLTEVRARLGDEARL